MFKLFNNKSFWLTLGATLLMFPAQGSFAYHFPWDQGHDTTDYTDPDDEGPEDCDGSGRRSPVFVCKGHFIWGSTDVLLIGRPNLSIERTYMSHNYTDGIFGNGWAAPAVETLVRTVKYSEEDQTEATVEYALTSSAGVRDVYIQQDDGSFVNPARRFDTLQPQDDGTTKLIARDTSYKLFNASGLLVQYVDRNDNIIFLDYDSETRLVQLRDQHSRSITLTYDANGRVSTAVDNSGRLWQYAYDELGNLLSVTDPLGGATSYTYETYVPDGDIHTYFQLTKVTDPSGVVLAEITYTDEKVRTHKTGTNIYTYTYQPQNNTTVKTDSTGSRWTFVYNDQEQVIRETDPVGVVVERAYDENGRETSMIDGEGYVWEYNYDVLGRVQSTVSPRGFTTLFEYESDTSWLNKLTSPSGRESILQYDANGNITTATDSSGATSRVQWDAFGSASSVSDALGNRQDFEHNAIGLLLSSTDVLGRLSTYFFDDLGRMTSLRLPDGQTTQYTYDALDRKIRTTDALGQTTEYQYDAAGRLLSVTDGNNGVTQFQYDVFGRQTKEIRADGGEISYTYLTDNLIGSTTDPSGSVTRHVYDAAKRVAREEAGAEVTTYTYNARSLPVTIAGPDSTLNYEYDEDGRVSNESQGSRSISYVHNNEGEITQYSALNETVQLDYDSRGFVNQVQSPAGTHQFQYDQRGLLTGHTLPGGQANSFGFDAAGQLLTMDYSQSSGDVYDYTYDANSRISAISGDGASQWQFEYDDVSRLTRAQHEQNYSFTYDSLDNRQESSQVHDVYNRLTRDNQYSFAYDPAGNLTRQVDLVTGEEQRYQYNIRGRLSRYERSNSANGPAITTATYEYDPIGRRSAKVVNGVRTEYLWQGTNVLGEFQGDSVIRQYRFDGSNSAQEFVVDGATYQIHKDHLGTPKSLSDASGQVVWRNTMSPYGIDGTQVDVDGDGTDIDFPVRFPGQYRDAESGLNYNYFRYYNAESGRYIKADPIGVNGGINAYAYAQANPIMSADPNGLCPWCIGAAIGGLLDLGIQLAQNGGNFSCVSWGQVAGATAMGAVGGGFGSALGRRGLTAGLKGLSNGTKGRIGEALSVGKNRLQGSRLLWTQQKVPGQRSVIDSAWRARNGSAYYVESKFGTAGLTAAQRATQRGLGSSYHVEKWTYPFFGNVGAGAGSAAGGLAGGAAASAAGNDCGCK